MSIPTGISPTLRQPKTFHKAIYQKGGSSLLSLPQLLLLVGQAKGGMGVAGSIYPCDNTETSEAIAGVGTPLDLMFKAARLTADIHGQGPAIYLCPLDEPGAGTASTNTIVFATNATTSGLHTFRIAGRTYPIAVAAGATPTAQGDSLAAAVNADRTSPVTAVNVAGTVTFTNRVKGINGNAVVFERLALPTVPGGTTVAILQPVNGAGVSSIVAALAASAGIDFDAIAIDGHAAQDVTDAKAHTLTMWNAATRKWRRVVLGENGTSGTITALVTASDDLTLSVMGVPKAKSLPGELAAMLGVALTNRTRPNANWDGLTLPAYGPDFADVPSDFESLLAVGATPGAPVVDPVTRTSQPFGVRIVKAVTTAQTLGGFSTEVTRDVAVPSTFAFVARQIDANWGAKFGADANPDGVLDDDDTIERVRLMVETILRDCEDRKILRNVDASIALLKIERDPDAPGRINIDTTYYVVVGAHQLAIVHRVTVGG